MAKHIPRDFIEDLINRTDIVNLVSNHIKLKRSGQNYSACCPFHDEKTPSFTVSQTKQFYYCFGCGANGNAISFMMEHLRMNFVESVEYLAKSAGLNIPFEDHSAQRSSTSRTGGAQLVSGKPGSKTNQLTTILEKAATYFQAQLRSPQGKMARQYCAKRQLSSQTLETFKIGWAPDNWNHFSTTINQTEQQLALKAGLIGTKKTQGFYERFRGRLMFPIRNPKGQVIAFGGRVLNDAKPKYLNSPETACFEKSRTLYGLHEFLNSKSRSDSIIVVEGYLDVIALHQAELPQTVATLGTSTSAHHLTYLLQRMDKIQFCFDGDKAGLQAAVRALQTALPYMDTGKEMTFAILPAGEDPDSLVEQGVGSFLQVLENALPLSEFLLNHLSQGLNLRQVDARASLIERAKPYIAKIPEGLYKTLLIDSLAKRAAIEVSTVTAALINSSPTSQRPTHRTQPQDQWQTPTQNHNAQNYNTQKQSSFKHSTNNFNPSKRREWPYSPPQPMLPNLNPKLSIIDTLIALILQTPALSQEFVYSSTVENVQLPNKQLLIAVATEMKHNNNCSLAYLLGQWHNSPEGKQLASIAARRFIIDKQKLPDEFKGALKQLEKTALEQALDKASQNPSIEELERLFKHKASMEPNRND